MKRRAQRRPGRVAAVMAIAVVLASGATLVPSPAGAKGAAIFTVANFPVQAKAANAVAAKERAIADGQAAAFRSLLKRLVPVTAYQRLKGLRSVPVQNLIDGFAVRSERNSTTEYIASFDFAFRADAVRNLLRKENVPFIEEQAPEVVVMAGLREGGKLDRSSDTATTWQGMWRDLDLKNALTPMRLEPVKAVIHNDTLNMLAAGDDSAIRVLANEYGGENIVAAIAEVDRPGKRIHVTLAGRDAVGVFNLKRSYRLDEGDVDYSLELAAVVSMGIVEGRWKSIKARSYGGVEAMSSGGEPVRMQVEFQGLAEWNAVRARMLETPGVADVSIEAISARSADVQLTYPGGGGPLANAFAARGLTLTSIGGNWFLRASF